MKADIKSIIFGQLITYCEQVLTGTKLVAEIGIDKIYTKFVQETVKKEGCKAVFDFKRSKERTTAYIYKYNFVALLIKELWFKKKEEQPSPLEIWASGKLFGYSDHEIALYLWEHGYIDKV